MNERRALRIAIYQYEVRDEAPNARLTRLGEVLAGRDTPELDLIVCPELFLSGYKAEKRFHALSEPIDGPFARSISKLARQRQTAVCYGYPESVSGACYNSAVCMGKNGELLANHRKLLFPTTTRFEQQYFSKGNALTFFELEGHRIGLLICYEVEFPELVRALAVAGCGIVIVPTALTSRWGLVASKMVHTRAFENGIYLVYANYAGTEQGTDYLGSSVIIAPDGTELVRAADRECIISASLDPGRVDVEQARHSYLINQKTVREVTG